MISRRNMIIFRHSLMLECTGRELRFFQTSSVQVTMFTRIQIKRAPCLSQRIYMAYPQGVHPSLFLSASLHGCKCKLFQVGEREGNWTGYFWRWNRIREIKRSYCVRDTRSKHSCSISVGEKRKVGVIWSKCTTTTTTWFWQLNVGVEFVVDEWWSCSFHDCTLYPSEISIMCGIRTITWRVTYAKRTGWNGTNPVALFAKCWLCRLELISIKKLDLSHLLGGEKWSTICCWHVVWKVACHCGT